MKVSVLVAVYNAEKYLKRCLDSLLRQTLSEIQIICINDGSTDSSIDILESYKLNNKNIEVYSQENRGASAARNLGLKYAIGEYICMVDSDDYISDECLEKTYNVVKENKLDAGIFKLILTDGKINSDFKNKYKNKIITGKEACILSLDWKIPGLGLYKTEIITSIKYDTSNINGDELSTRKFFFESGKVGFSSGEYYYFKNDESITRKISIKRFDQLKNKIELYNFLIEKNILKDAEKVFNFSVYNEILSTIKLVKSLDEGFFNQQDIKGIKKLQKRALDIVDLKILRKEYIKKMKIKKFIYTYLHLEYLYKVV